MKLLDVTPAESLTNLAGLQRHLLRTSSKPKTLTAEGYLALSEEDKEAYDDARILYLNRELTVDTPAVTAALSDVRRLLRSNYGKASGRHGLLLSGPPRAGKTHTALAILRATMNRYLADYPDPRAEGIVPVVFIDVPPAATAKSMMHQFCDFLGMTRGPRFTLEELTYMATQTMLRGRTALIVVDEVHNLNNSSANTRDAIRALKGLSNALPATFIYCGVNLEKNGLLSGDEGLQIAGRFTLRRMLPHSYGSLHDRDEWGLTVQAFETGVGLINAGERCLDAHEEYLFSRTSGSIGSLGYLIRSAAIELILSDAVHEHGEERITRELLDSIPLDLAAERGADLDG
ncbi:TniB family NTP-binding protein [Leifsonia sp. Root4]|uniref:TniB family NTP-binding protein n=1 Tax=Leifsonia sp. Root4 TaxID=1736525 RepID=UPI0009ECB7DB|nr:TniB family NTP-binding protein [Leifsonia sp. Root4]